MLALRHNPAATAHHPMLYTFKSPAAGNLIMLQPNGQRVLEIIGKDADPQGIITPEQMPAAIAALETAVTQEAASQQALKDKAKGSGEVASRPEGVSLRQRVLPFIDMLKRCHKAGKEIVWGV